jgi:fructose-1,6-bisphosphatase/inositol monophosphatase family enzyme
MVYAVRGGATHYCVDGSEPTPTRVSDTKQLEDATFLTSEVASFSEDRTPPARHVYEYLEQKCRLTRTWGDAYGYLLVATGRADVMIDPVMNLWDAAPLKPIIEGAGGKFTDWKGTATVRSGDAVAANPKLMDQVLAVTREH